MVCVIAGIAMGYEVVASRMARGLVSGGEKSSSYSRYNDWTLLEQVDALSSDTMIPR